MSLPLAELLYQAGAAEFGIVVETDNPGLLRSKLYSLMRSNPELPQLSLVISPFNGRDVWILKKEPSNVEEPGADPEGDA